MITTYQTPQTLLIITDYYAGEEMMEYLSKEKDIRTKDMSRISYQLLSTINYCSENSIIYWDINQKILCSWWKHQILHLSWLTLEMERAKLLMVMVCILLLLENPWNNLLKRIYGVLESFYTWGSWISIQVTLRGIRYSSWFPEPVSQILTRFIWRYTQWMLWNAGRTFVVSAWVV